MVAHLAGLNVLPMSLAEQLAMTGPDMMNHPFGALTRFDSDTSSFTPEPRSACQP
jgi:hypothetical protein